MLCGQSHISIGKSGAKSACKRNRRLKRAAPAKTRLHDQHRARKSQQQAQHLPARELFADEYPREEHREEWRSLVERHRLAYRNLRECVEVGEDSYCPEDGAKGQEGQG